MFQALKAERHRLHNIHFRIIVDAGFLAQMMKSPDLPNTAMTRWITYIQLFTFEINHTPGIAHCIPDGLSHWLHAADNSDYSNGDIDVKDGIKLVKALPLEINMMSYEERRVENSLRVHETLSMSKLERVPGEVRALECQWSSPGMLLHDFHQMYVGEGEEVETEEESERITHQHHIQDKDREEYWKEMLAYLHLGWLPDSQPDAEKLQ